MSEISSTGLMGLPHFRTSRISMENQEPLYLNLFYAEIMLPEMLTNSTDNGGASAIPESDKMLLLEEIQKIDGLQTDMMPQTVKQTYKFAERNFAASGPESTSVELSIDFALNIRGSKEGNPDNYILKMLRRWNDLVWDPLTGRQGIKTNYVAPWMKVTMHDKSYNPYWQWTFYNIFPTSPLNGPTLEYSQKTGIHDIKGYKLKCDYWDEVML